MLEDKWHLFIVCGDAGGLKRKPNEFGKQNYMMDLFEFKGISDLSKIIQLIVMFMFNFKKNVLTKLDYQQNSLAVLRWSLHFLVLAYKDLGSSSPLCSRLAIFLSRSYQNTFITNPPTSLNLQKQDDY